MGKRKRYIFDEHMMPSKPLYVAPLGSAIHYGSSTDRPATTTWNNNQLSRTFRSKRSVMLVPETVGDNYYPGAYKVELLPRKAAAVPKSNLYLNILLTAKGR